MIKGDYYMDKIQINNLNFKRCGGLQEYVNLKFPAKDENEKIEMELCQQVKKQGNEVVLDVSDKLLSDINKFSNRIFEIKGYFERLDLIYRLFIAELADFNKILNIQKKDINDTVDLIKANRYFLNLISNGKLVVDFSENQIKRIFGSKSKEAKNIHLITSEIYEKSNVYRLFYNLRNFSQHHSFPVTLIKTKMIDETHYKCYYFVEVDNLLKSNFEFQRAFVSDLNEYKAVSNSLNLEELVMPYFEDITKLFGNYNKFYLKLYKDELMNIKNKLVQQGLDEGKYYVARFSKKEINLSENNFILKPVYGITDIDKIFIDLSKMGLVELKKV